MAIALVVSGGFNLNQNGGTSTGIDTTGADLIVLAVAHDGGVTPTTAHISDSRGLTWSQLTSYKTANEGVRFFYVQNANGGTGHTFTVTLNNSFAGIGVAAFSGTQVSSVFDAENGATSSGTTQVITGSVTPAADGSLVIAAFASISTAGSASATNLSMLTEVNLVGGQSYACAVAYEIQTTATARSETFNTGTAADLASAIAVFKATTGGGGGGSTGRLLGGNLFNGGALVGRLIQ